MGVSSMRRTMPLASSRLMQRAICLWLLLPLLWSVSSLAETRAKIADCRIESGGVSEFAGKCRFMLDGDTGSFSLDSTDHQSPLYRRILVVSVSVVSAGAAEVFVPH